MAATGWELPSPSSPSPTPSARCPLYAFYSIVRLLLAYLLSLAFAISYGYIAAYNPRIEAWMIAVLDILQSIPVLSFLPPVVLAMVALVPGHQLGIELGVILLIFTGQVWNLAFSFYSSLKSIPREMLEASRIYRYSAWQRFWQLEMPNAAIGLVWNSIVSVAGGWFALIACEMFTMDNRSFQLPGLGSYLKTATDTGDIRALMAGIAGRHPHRRRHRPAPLASPHRLERQVQIRAGRVLRPHYLPHPRTPAALQAPLRTSRPPLDRHSKSPSTAAWPAPAPAASFSPSTKIQRPRPASAGFWTVAVLVLALIGWGAFHAVIMLRQITWPDLRLLLEGAGATFLRVNASLLISAAWTIPVGVAIGFNPKLARIVQPLAQVMASVPATAFFPILLLGLVKLGGGLGIGSIALMLLGTQWYILFNVIAGAMSIPSDLREAATLYKFTRVAALDHPHPPRHLPLPHHRHGHRLGRRLERQRLCRIFQAQRPHPHHHRPRRPDPGRHRRTTTSPSSCSPPS